MTGLVTVVFTLAMLLNGAADEAETTQLFVIAGTGILINGFYQSILLLKPKDINSLLPRVIICIIAGLAGLTAIAIWISGKSWTEVGFFRKIVISFVFLFSIMVIIIITSRKLIEFAQQDDR